MLSKFEYDLWKHLCYVCAPCCYLLACIICRQVGGCLTWRALFNAALSSTGPGRQQQQRTTTCTVAPLRRCGGAGAGSLCGGGAITSAWWWRALSGSYRRGTQDGRRHRPPHFGGDAWWTNTARWPPAFMLFLHRTVQIHKTCKISLAILLSAAMTSFTNGGCKF